MAGFQTKTFTKHDDYMTPSYAWDNIKHLIPKDKIIWESAYGDGESGKYLENLGFKIIHKNIDYLKTEPTNWDIQITNPPFTIKKEWFNRAKELNKPFIIISPASMICTQYIRKLFQNEKLQIIIPRKRIHFIKMINGKIKENQKNICNFDCFYYCWKMELDKDIIWLD